MNDTSFLDGPPPAPRESQTAKLKRAETAFFRAMDASEGARGCLRMSGATWKLVACGLAPYGGVGVADEWGAIWFDGRLKLRIDNDIPDFEVRFEA